jgi:hypothetical protein
VQPLTSQADMLLLMLASWFCVSYCAVASGVDKTLPGFIQACIFTTEVRATELGLFLPLATTASFAFIVVAVAAHARSHKAKHLWTVVRRRALEPKATRDPSSPLATTSDAPSSHSSSAVSVATYLFMHTLGNAVVPALWFTLGMFRLCPAGTFYAVGPAVEVLPFQALAAAPKAPQSLSLSRHMLMRTYAALHIALLYCLGLVPDQHMPEWVSAARDFLAGAVLPASLLAESTVSCFGRIIRL